MIEIAPGVNISESELNFSFDRSPGPGGQNANKVNTRVTLHFDVGSSMSLSNAQRNHLRQALGNRITQDGVLRIISSKERTQLANRRAALNRFIEVAKDAFKAAKPRKATRAPASAAKKRLDAKTRRGAAKRTRGAGVSFDD